MEIASYCAWYWPNHRGYYWLPLTIYGWDGGLHVVDDFGFLVPVLNFDKERETPHLEFYH